MRFRRSSEHRLIAATDAESLTGLSLEALLGETDVQTLLRVNADGTSERLLRVPLALILGATDEEPAHGDGSPRAT